MLHMMRHLGMICDRRALVLILYAQVLPQQKRQITAKECTCVVDWVLDMSAVRISH